MNYNKALQTNDGQVISKLSDKIKEMLKLDLLPNKLTEKQFIQVVIKDYNFYTGKDS